MHTLRPHPLTVSHTLRRLLAPALVLLAAVLAPALHAQTALLATTKSTAPTSELRLASHGFGRAALVDANGAQYGSIGWFGSDLRALEQYSPAAAARVRTFKRERALGSALLAVGGAIAAGALYQYAHGDHFAASDPATAAYIGGSAAVAVGLVRLSIGQQNLRAALKLRNQR
jgi:hypothetical protein